MIELGMLMRVKPEVWREWCLRHQHDYMEFKPQPVIALPAHMPYDKHVMLAFPYYWWHEDELEEVDAALENSRKPVAKYTRNIHVTGFQQNDQALKEFNKAWGFVDGHCNDLTEEGIVEREYPTGFQEAQTRLWRSALVTLEISVYKDGSRTFRIYDCIQ